jgi:Mn-dependent DtxR family transcriptional regulator
MAPKQANPYFLTYEEKVYIDQNWKKQSPYQISRHLKTSWNSVSAYIRKLQASENNK